MTKYCDIVELCESLDELQRPQFTSYGVTSEYGFHVANHLAGKSAETISPSPKPSLLFRGQKSAHQTLQAWLFRPYGLACTWQKELTVRLRSGNDS